VECKGENINMVQLKDEKEAEEEILRPSARKT